jgi:hypothetical protein
MQHTSLVLLLRSQQLMLVNPELYPKVVDGLS